MLTQIGQWLASRLVTQCVGLSIYVNNDGKRCFQLLLLEKQKGGDLTVLAKERFEQLAEVKEWLTEYPTAPIVCLLDGKSVLVRFLPTSGDSTGLDRSKILKQVVPTGKEEEFIINSYFTDTGIITAVSRIDYVSQIINEFKEEGVQVLNIALGLPGYVQFESYFNTDQIGQLAYGQYTIEKGSSGYTAISRKPNVDNELQLGEYRLTHHEIPAFGVAAQYFMPTNAVLDIEEVTPEQKEEHYNHQLHKVLMMAIPGILLVLLLINTLVFFNANSQNAVLKEASAGKQLMYKTYTEKKKQYDQRKAIIDQLNSANSHFAFISDQVGGAVPSGIILTDMSVFPYVEKGRVKQFEREKLVIKGESNNATVFGRFIDKVERLSFVEDIAYQDYSFNNRKGKGVFHIEVLMGELE